MQYFIGVTSINLYSNEISDISSLGNLEKLEYLYLDDNKIIDLRTLGNINLSNAGFASQAIELAEVSVEKVVPLYIFNSDGSFPTFNTNSNVGRV